ncbi:MAG: hypothetical protein NC393_08250 [Clostridium sp.]|nr:hypothetical protein [Clostridium sp.]MCM1208990.1 hypothetical protein [Ruminococcus sp.]
MIVNILLGMSSVTKRDVTALGVYVVEAYKNNISTIESKTLIKYEVIGFEHTNSNVIALTLLNTALKHIQNADKVQIFTDNLFVLSMQNNINRHIEQRKVKNGVGQMYESLCRPIEDMIINYDWSVSNIRYEQKALIQDILKQGCQKNA